jgi:hypothetical protein
VIFYTLKFDCLPVIQEPLDFKGLFQEALEFLPENQVERKPKRDGREQCFWV